jgi:hypothetical protein
MRFFRGAPAASSEAELIELLPLSDIPGLVAEGRIRAATTAAALLHLWRTRAIRG